MKVVQVLSKEKTKGLLTNLALLTCSLILCLLILEAVAIALSSESQASVFCGYQADQKTGWALQPNLEKQHTGPKNEYAITIETNSLGQRGPEPDASEYSILVLGDSFVFGQGVEENEAFTSLLSKSLREKGKSVSVANAGVPGYSTKQELAYLEKYLEKETPDLVVLGFFAGNDVYGNLENDFRYETENGCLKAKPQPATDLKSLLRNNLKSYSFFAERIRAVPVLREILMALGLMQEKRPPAHLLCLENPPPGPMEQAWSETEAQLERAQQLAQKHGLTIVVLAIPSNFQVYDDLRKSALEAYGIPPKNFEYNFPERKLSSILEDKPNLILVELLEASRLSGFRLYFESDPHWNSYGHALAAQILEKELLEKGLI
jgi:lysophospholipase L1-like esterase